MRNLLIVIFCCFIFNISAQEKTFQRITLNSGSTYTGEILVQNNEIIMLRDINGARFQIAPSEIKSIEPISTPTTETQSNTSTLTTIEPEKGNFRAMIEVGYLSLTAKNAFNSIATVQGNLILGSKNVFGENIFLGGGIGYLNSDKIADKNLILIPIFIKVYTLTTKNRTSPLLGIESGYTFSANSYYKGDLFCTLNLGFSTKLASSSSLTICATAGIYGINTDLTEYNANGTFNYYGFTNIYTLGLKAGIQF